MAHEKLTVQRQPDGSMKVVPADSVPPPTPPDSGHGDTPPAAPTPPKPTKANTALGCGCLLAIVLGILMVVGMIVGKKDGGGAPAPATSAPSTATTGPVDRATAEKARDQHLASANALFSKKEYEKAITEYKAASKALPPDTTDASWDILRPAVNFDPRSRVLYAIAAVMADESASAGGLDYIFRTLSDADLKALRDSKALPPDFEVEIHGDAEMRSRLIEELPEWATAEIEAREDSGVKGPRETAGLPPKGQEAHFKLRLAWHDRHMINACVRVLEEAYARAKAEPDKTAIVVEVWTDPQGLVDKYGNAVKEDLSLGVVRFPDPAEIRKYKDGELFSSTREWQAFVKARLARAANILDE
ncbi:MAG: hypothetical protein L6R43_04520 [Planctomycetes bacterium]|nr:hypothetical protein [Planctomycetota bacterium]